MRPINLEQFLADENGQRLIGYLMANDHIYDSVMPQLSLLDLSPLIISNIENHYLIKSEYIRNNDLDIKGLVFELDPIMKKLILDLVTEIPRDTSPELTTFSPN